jgi:AraC-like DNA-binding protein
MNFGPVYTGDQAVPHLAAEGRVTAPPGVGPRPVAVVPAIGDRLRILHSSWLGRIEDFSAPGDCPAPRGHSPEYQLVFPYAGAFEYHLGVKTMFLDATRVLFVGAGEDYADVHVAGHGHDSIIITPHLSLLQELCGHAVPSRHPAFRCVTKPTTPPMTLRNHRLLRLEPPGNDLLARDELMIALIDQALEPAQRVVRAAPLRVVDRAKQFLHAHLCEPTSLNEIAHAVQVSGAYLTDAFTGSEGVPLCHYCMRLRLNRALVDLPRCEDITGLALDLGFFQPRAFQQCLQVAFRRFAVRVQGRVRQASARGSNSAGLGRRRRARRAARRPQT